MTDSMTFGPDWIRNLSSEGMTGGGAGGGTKYQLADYRYGREEMLALFDKNTKPPASITNFKCLYSDTCLQPLALLPTADEEQRGGGWQGRPNTLLSGPPRGRGGSLERGGRISRGRGYQYGRPTSGYEGGWGNGEQPDWSPRKEYGNQRTSMDNWRRGRNEEDEWRSGTGPGRSEKWVRSTSWRGEGDSEERTGPPERGGRTSWNDNRGHLHSRKSWENEDHLPEWATENPTEGGGTFDEKGAFHGSDDEEPEGKPPNKSETNLQKSTSQQHISPRSHAPPITSSKSLSIIKSEDTSHKKEIINENHHKQKEEDKLHNVKQKDSSDERKKPTPNIPEKIDKEIVLQERARLEGPPKLTKLSEKPVVMTNGPADNTQRRDDSDFERLQEDLVLKLVVDEDVPKHLPNNFDVANIQPPPNLVAGTPIMDKWYYQDPQGQMQGPFPNAEMAEWYKAGYFSNQLKVRRQCDERFFLLGELITMCAGANPFQSGIRFSTLKNETIPKIPTEPDILQLQYLTQMAAYKQAQARLLTEPWNAITLQQQELAAQRLIMQQQQVSQDLQYLQQSQAANPLMHMINQMQQANKLPGQGLVDKSQSIPGNLDPHLQLHMSNLLSMQNRLPTTGMPNNIPAGLGNSIPGSLPQPEGLSTSLPSLQTSQLNAGNMPISGIQSNIPVSIGGSINLPRPTSRGSEQIPSSQSSDPISSLLKQLQQQQQKQPTQDALWQQNSFPPNNGTSQWQPKSEVPISMWDIQNTPPPNMPSPPLTQSEKLQQALQPKPTKVDKEKEQKQKEEALRELKKKKEQEEKQAKKDADEKRKQEQRKHEAEKKASEERRKKEDERIKRELEKARKEAEEKRLRELEEKRKLKEQRKLEEAMKKAEEQKKLEDEKIRQETKEKEARRLEDERKSQQEQQRLAKIAPWSQANSNMGLSLAEIQKAEREKRALDATIQMQRLQEKEQQQQLQQEKAPVPQFNWARKPVEPRKVKSLAEIQAEEQEKLLKQAAETRLQKEKEPAPVINNTGTSIWSNQNLTWASSSANWSSSGGFWDDSSTRQAATKPSTVTKSNSTNNFSAPAKPQVQKSVKSAKPAKKDETKNHNNNNEGPSSDEFMNWCFKTLSNISTNVDIPTFVAFLRDIESAFDVKEYCKEYLGDNNATHQFALNFLEKRRSFKPKNYAHKDDMCSPAPAITPSLQHSTEFQEVKGKNKKNKKSKMLKVDARILGFNVTSAPDRINVGDRDYGDNS